MSTRPKRALSDPNKKMKYEDDDDDSSTDEVEVNEDSSLSEEEEEEEELQKKKKKAKASAKNPATKPTNIKSKEEAVRTMVTSSDRGKLEELILSSFKSQSAVSYDQISTHLALPTKLAPGAVTASAMSTLATARGTGYFLLVSDEHLREIFTYLPLDKKLMAFSLCKCFLSFRKEPSLFRSLAICNSSWCGRTGAAVDFPTTAVGKLSKNIPTEVRGESVNHTDGGLSPAPLSSTPAWGLSGTLGSPRFLFGSV